VSLSLSSSNACHVRGSHDRYQKAAAGVTDR
jgi:hypothetical protein